MTEKKQGKWNSGINDPWRLYSKDRKKGSTEKNDSPTGAPGSIHPLDADLLPLKQYVFRHTQATGDLLVRGADNEKDAAILLLSVIQQIPAFKDVLEREGFIYGISDTLPISIKGFVIKAGNYVLCLPTAKNIASGLSQLVKVIKSSVFKEQLGKAGIVPLLK